MSIKYNYVAFITGSLFGLVLTTFEARRVKFCDTSFHLEFIYPFLSINKPINSGNQKLVYNLNIKKKIT